MERITLGGTDISVSRLALGTWAFGGDPVWGDQSDRASIDTVCAALDLGIDFIDTAAGYAGGRSEEVVGRALKGRRDRAVIATKVGRTLSRDGIVKAAEDSLRRLGTDYLDVYYIHWPNPGIPLDESLSGLGALREAGKIRAAGVCNFGPLWLRDLAAARDAGIVAVHQLPYSLFWRAIEFEIMPATTTMGHTVVAYSTLAQGLLTGSFRSAGDVPKGLRISRFYSGGAHGEPGCEDEVFAALDGLRALAAETGIAMSDLAIGWVLSRPGVGVALTGARTPDEIRANAAALDRHPDARLFERMCALAEPVRARLGPNPDMWMNAAQSRFR